MVKSNGHSNGQELSPFHRDTEGNGVSIYIAQASAMPLLDAQQEQELARSIVTARTALQDFPFREIPLRAYAHLYRLEYLLAHDISDYRRIIDENDIPFENREDIPPYFSSKVQELKTIEQRLRRSDETPARLKRKKEFQQRWEGHIQAGLEIVHSLYLHSGQFYRLAQNLKEDQSIPEPVKITLRHRERVYYALREQFSGPNLRLVISTARTYSRYGLLPLADLIQEGNIGLLKAIEKFDYQRGYKFSTYATWWIRQSIQKALSDKSRNIRLPAHLFEALKRMHKIEYGLLQKLDRDPTPKELAQHCGLSVEKIEKLQRIIVNTVPLDEYIDSDDGNWSRADYIEDERSLNPLEEIEREELRRAVDRTMSRIPSREANIIKRRFGISTDDHDLTLEEVGDQYGLTKERIRQLQVRGMEMVIKHSDTLRDFRK